MQYTVIHDNNFDSLWFSPTIIVGFYRSSHEESFLTLYHTLTAQYEDVDIIGCSSGVNISDTVPYIEEDGASPIVCFCCDMEKDAFTLHLLAQHQRLEPDTIEEQIILLSSFSSSYLETLLVGLSHLQPYMEVLQG